VLRTTGPGRPGFVTSCPGVLRLTCPPTSSSHFETGIKLEACREKVTKYHIRVPFSAQLEAGADPPRSPFPRAQQSAPARTLRLDAAPPQSAQTSASLEVHGALLRPRPPRLRAKYGPRQRGKLKPPAAGATTPPRWPRLPPIHAHPLQCHHRASQRRRPIMAIRRDVRLAPES
jgi:hypothetical protein